MNRYRHGVMVLALITLLIGGACTEEDAPTDTKSGRLALQLQLGLPVEMDVVTRAAAAIQVNDIWVIQFIAAASATPSKMVVKSYENAAGSADIISWDESEDKYKITTQADFENADSEFYVIANAGSTHTGLSALGESSPLSALKACVKKIRDDALTLDDITNEPGILVAGPVKFTKKESGSNNTNASISAHLQRAYAKVTVTWDVKPEVFTEATFTATSLTVQNLPRTISFFERAGAESGNYPAESDISTDEIISTSSTKTASFYMAENLRGIGISSTAHGKNLLGNGPISESSTRSLAGCTCITLSGNYKYNNIHTGEVGVKYRFYLGGNLINDYNVRRGYAYALNITISGVNSADLRVSITDGNVAVFDQVTKIEEIEVEI